VFLAEPALTPYDLRFRLFGVDVRVHPLFWLVSVLLGWPAYERGDAVRGVAFLLLWVGCVFVSILLHEFGHVLVGWYFGSKGHIVLYSFGGVAIGSSQLSRRWQRIAVLLAGPGIQLVLWAILDSFFLLHRTLYHGVPSQGFLWALRNSPYVAELIWDLWWINLFWPLLNLLPVYPLDGGQITREIAQAVSPQGGTAFSLGLSMVTAGVLAVHMFLGDRSPIPYLPQGGLYGALVFLLLAVSSFQALQMENERRRRWYREDELPWER
jgi:membrane-associated protease RseP (regulator of RpoE activity)